MKPLSPWLPAVLRKAGRVVEDSDRVTYAASLLMQTIRRLHVLVVVGAHDTPEPRVQRIQSDDGGVSLIVEWLDKESGWFLAFNVARVPGAKPTVGLEFSGNPDHYLIGGPTDPDISKALHDYFQKWKTEP